MAVCASIGVLSSALGAEDTPLNIKSGLWEVTAQGQHNSMPPMSPETLAKMTPEERARLQAALNDPRVYKSCLTQQQVDHLFEMGGLCKNTTLSSTSTVREGTVQCNTFVSAAYHLEALDQESIRGSWDVTMGSAGRTANTLKLTFHGRWLTADCGTVKSGQQAQ